MHNALALQFIVGWGCSGFFVIIIYKNIKKGFFCCHCFFFFILVMALQNFLLSFENCLFLSELFVETQKVHFI